MCLTGVEKPLYLDGGVFNGVAGVADVFHAGGTHVAADGAGGGLGGIGGAKEITDGLYCVFALKYECQHGARAHELDDVRKERPISNVRVVLLEQFVGECDELGGADFKAGFFKAANHLAGVVAIETIGFQ